VIKRYAALIRNAWLVDLQYRASIVLWLLWGVTEPAIALGIWWAIAGDGSVAGYARADFARYFFAVMLINQLTIAWDSWYLDRWIREGELNYRLARPLHPAHEAVAENIAYKARTASVILVVWLLVAAAWPAVRLPLDPGRWALTLVAVLLAAAMRFFISFTTACWRSGRRAPPRSWSCTRGCPCSSPAASRRWRCCRRRWPVVAEPCGFVPCSPSRLTS